jgi:uncharacterized protein YndB with AHSA1/START domain
MESRQVESKVEIDAEIEHVWKALTDAKELTRWFPLDARVKSGSGGTIWLGWRMDFEWEHRIDVWDPPRHLVLGYEVPPSGEGAPARAPAERHSQPVQVAVDYQLETQEGKTKLQLIHSGFPNSSGWDDEFDAVRRGWMFELAGLRHYLERHRGEDRTVAWARALLDAPAESVWNRLMSPRGFQLEDSSRLAPGDPYILRTADGDRFEGVIQNIESPRELDGTVANHNDALFRISVFAFQGRTDIHLWLSTYGWPGEAARRQEKRWCELLRGLFPEAEIR